MKYYANKFKNIAQIAILYIICCIVYVFAVLAIFTQ